MDLSFGEEYEAFREEVRQFIRQNKRVAEAAREEARQLSENKEGKTPQSARRVSKKLLAWQKLLIDNGYTQRTVPKAYGGYGAQADIVKSRIISEEFGAAGFSAGLAGQGIDMLVPTLLEMGTEEQKQRFIKPTIEGRMIWCQGYSEPGSGSDLASLSTRAELDGDEWVINGQKIWTSTAREADWIFCLVRTEPDAPKHQGISFLLFSMDTPGIEIRPLVDMTMKANFNEVFFTDVRVPKHQIVGQRGQGWQVANAILKHERGSLAPTGIVENRLNALIKMMQSEKVAGKAVFDNPVFRDRVMKMQGRLMAMKYNDMRLLSAQINEGQPVGIAGMIVKLQTTELRHELEALAIDVMGEIGLAFGDNPYLRDNGSWQTQYMYNLGLIIGGGTSQIQKNIISERGLGMPREPKVEIKPE